MLFHRASNTIELEVLLLLFNGQTVLCFVLLNRRENFIYGLCVCFRVCVGDSKKRLMCIKPIQLNHPRLSQLKKINMFSRWLVFCISGTTRIFRVNEVFQSNFFLSSKN